MSYYPRMIPDEAVWYIDLQFERFHQSKPSKKCIDEIGDFIIKYVVKNSYFFGPLEASRRYSYPGLTDPEKHQLLAPLEYRLKAQLMQEITFDQLHLGIWAAMMFCWSQEGEEAVLWYRRTEEINEKANKTFVSKRVN